MQPIANKTDVQAFLPVAKGCQAKEIEFYIMEEQMLTLRNWLGDCFFKELELKGTEDKFQILINGGSWDSGKKYCDGLKKVLSYLAYGEYVLLNNYTDTAFGTKIKNFQDGLPTPPEQLERMRVIYRNKGIAFFESCKDYLCANKAYFCYQGECLCDNEPRNKRSKIRTLYNSDHDAGCGCHTCKEYTTKPTTEPHTHDFNKDFK